MKNKLSTIILVLIFIILLMFCNKLLDNEPAVINNENKKEESSMEILSVSKENFESEVLKSENPVLIDFYADWCGPCKMVSPIVEQLAKEHEDVKVVKINIDDNQELAVNFGVTAIPTLIVVKNGEEVTRTVGVASKSEIEAMIFSEEDR